MEVDLEIKLRGLAPGSPAVEDDVYEQKQDAAQKAPAASLRCLRERGGKKSVGRRGSPRRRQVKKGPGIMGTMRAVHGAVRRMGGKKKTR